MSNVGKKGRGWTDLQLQTILQYFGGFFKAHFHSFLKAQNERNKYMSSNTSTHKLETDYVS